MKDVPHVQGPKKLAWQKEVVVSLLPTGELAQVDPYSKFICIYQILSKVPRVPLRKPRDIS